MPSAISRSTSGLAALEAQLAGHPLYGAIRSAEDLRIFMHHHAFSVWDFMSLLKYLQRRLAPASVPWKPAADAHARRIINQIVLEEESDIGPPAADGAAAYASHFEMYCQSMEEVGADASGVLRFAEAASERGIDGALALGIAPPAAAAFVRTTFDFIATDQPHGVAAAFTWGRERIIPGMFRRLLAEMGIGEREAPTFHHYLARHIHLDEDLHAPLALQMVETLVGGDATRKRQAEDAACAAISARIALWDGILAAISAHPAPETLGAQVSAC